MIELYYKKNIFSTIHRCLVLMLLLLAFAIGVKAQKYYVIYYDDNDAGTQTRYYMALDDGGRVVRTTSLSHSSYWMNNTAELVTAQGSQGKDLYNEERENYQYNQDNRKYLIEIYETRKIIDIPEW